MFTSLHYLKSFFTAYCFYIFLTLAQHWLGKTLKLKHGQLSMRGFTSIIKAVWLLWRFTELYGSCFLYSTRIKVKWVSNCSDVQPDTKNTISDKQFLNWHFFNRFSFFDSSYHGYGACQCKNVFNCSKRKDLKATERTKSPGEI